MSNKSQKIRKKKRVKLNYKRNKLIHANNVINNKMREKNNKMKKKIKNKNGSNNEKFINKNTFTINNDI